LLLQAHLADFELSRDESSATRTRVGLTTTVAGGGYSPQYLSPEMLSGAVVKPTTAADMYAYGVCALLLCCGHDACSFSASVSGELQEWSREAAAAADAHLPAMLESLLQSAVRQEEALALRLSATQVLLHPFLDTTAERAAASEASHAAQELALEAQEAKAVVRRQLQLEAERTQRCLEVEAAEARRLLQEEEEQARAAIDKLRRDMQKCRHELDREERQLHTQKDKLGAKAAEVQNAAKRVEAEKQAVSEKRKEVDTQKQRTQADSDAAKAAAERKRKELAAKEAELKKEESKLQAIRSKVREPPPYWDVGAARKASDPFVLAPLSRSRNGSVWHALEAFLQTDASQIGKGADTAKYPQYDRLELASAWRLQHREPAG
jgi:serine/threonine protein kinase